MQEKNIGKLFTKIYLIEYSSCVEVDKQFGYISIPIISFKLVGKNLFIPLGFAWNVYINKYTLISRKINMLLIKICCLGFEVLNLSKKTWWYSSLSWFRSFSIRRKNRLPFQIISIKLLIQFNESLNYVKKYWMKERPFKSPISSDWNFKVCWSFDIILSRLSCWKWKENWQIIRQDFLCKLELHNFSYRTFQGV